MKLAYDTVEGSQPERPPEVDEASSRFTVYLRRNIESVPNRGMEGNPAEGTHWRYEEARLSKADYAEYKKAVESPATQLLMQAAGAIEAEQEMQAIDRQEGTEAIMQAVSDLQADIALLGA